MLWTQAPAYRVSIILQPYFNAYWSMKSAAHSCDSTLVKCKIRQTFKNVSPFLIYLKLWTYITLNFQKSHVVMTNYSPILGICNWTTTLFGMDLTMLWSRVYYFHHLSRHIAPYYLFVAERTKWTVPQVFLLTALALTEVMSSKFDGL